MTKDLILKKLSEYQSSDPKQQQYKSQMISFCHEYNQCFSRDLIIGHFTASAFLLNPSEDMVLLTHHLKLDKWIQLGGHADGNSDLLAVSIKEAIEESGIEEIMPITENIFDLDIHQIPQFKNEPAHLHFDVRFLLKATRSEKFTMTSESKNLAWVNMNHYQELNLETSVERLFEKYRKNLVI